MTLNYFRAMLSTQAHTLWESKLLGQLCRWCSYRPIE